MFVSFDLEFSGLSKPKELGKQAGGPRRRMSLQEAYENAKEAVETYQLLQVGLCPVDWRQEDGECLYSFFAESKLTNNAQKHMLCPQYVYRVRDHIILNNSVYSC